MWPVKRILISRLGWLTYANRRSERKKVARKDDPSLTGLEKMMGPF